MKLKAWTDYPLFDDVPGKIAPIRECLVVGWDRHRYVTIEVSGVRYSIKRCYVYRKPGRVGEVPTFGNWWLTCLPKTD